MRKIDADSLKKKVTTDELQDRFRKHPHYNLSEVIHEIIDEMPTVQDVQDANSFVPEEVKSFILVDGDKSHIGDTLAKYECDKMNFAQPVLVRELRGQNGYSVKQEEWTLCKHGCFLNSEGIVRSFGNYKDTLQCLKYKTIPVGDGYVGYAVPAQELYSIKTPYPVKLKIPGLSYEVWALLTKGLVVGYANDFSADTQGYGRKVDSFDWTVMTVANLLETGISILYDNYIVKPESVDKEKIKEAEVSALLEEERRVGPDMIKW